MKSGFKLISLLLALTLVFSNMPLMAFAAETEYMTTSESESIPDIENELPIDGSEIPDVEDETPVDTPEIPDVEDETPIDGPEIPGGEDDTPIDTPEGPGGDTPGGTIIRGICGAEMTWTLYADGLMTISGTGRMDDFAATEPGWADYRASIKKLEVQEGVQSLGFNSFKDCVNLTEVQLPDGLTEIKGQSFLGCTALREVTFRGNAPAIEADAFKDVIITGNYPYSGSGWAEAVQDGYGGSIDWMGYGETDSTPGVDPDLGETVAGGACGETVEWALTEDGTLTVFGTGRMNDYEETEPGWYQYADQIKWIVVKPGVTYVGAYAFYDMDKLYAMELPGTVEEIGEGAFFDCGSLYSVEIPDGVKTVGLGAFAYSGISSAKVPGSVGLIGYYAFGSCPNLTAIEVDDSNAVYCDAEGVLFSKDMTELVTLPGGFEGGYAIPVGVISTAASAFAECLGLYSITIPGTVAGLGEQTFAGASNLADVIFEGPAPLLIGENCFAETGPTIWYNEAAGGWTAELMQNYGGTPTWLATSRDPEAEPTTVASGACGENLTWVLMDNGVLTVSGTGAMTDYSENAPEWITYVNMITKVVIEDGVEAVGNYAFFECIKITEVELGSTVTRIGEGAFGSCVSLQKVNIPAAVTTIGEGAFILCVSLPEITIPAGVTDIGPYALHYCAGLTAIHVESGNQNYSSRDGVLFNADGTKLILLPGGYSGSYSVPEGVTTIGSAAFELCDKLTAVTLPGTVTLVEDGAFCNVPGLKAVTFAGNPPAFGPEAFKESKVVCSYPAGNDTWTSDVMLSYGGTLAWAAYTPIETIAGDTDVDGDVDVDDAIYLLYHVLVGDSYPVYQNCDFDGSGAVDVDDAIYLLYHVLVGEEYPLGDAAATGDPLVALKLIAQEAELALLENYPGLKRLDLSGSTCYEAMEAFADNNPGVEVIYTVSIGSKVYTNDTTELTIPAEELDKAQLLANLKYLPRVTLVDMRESILTADDFTALTAAYPDVKLVCSLQLMDRVLASDITALDLSGITSADVEAVAAVLPGFTDLADVQLMNVEGKSELTLTDVKKLQDAQPNALFNYSFKLFGKTVSTTDESIAYYDKRIGDAGEEEIRQALDILTSCSYFKLDNCNISNEVMASIRDDYPDVKVVWRIWADRFTMCTDETMIRMTFNLDNKDIGSLKYCTDVTYMDIGHNTKLTDISFVEYMPDLECVIVSGAPVSDISYFEDHDKLIWLELVFCDRLKDISCLDTCDNLTYLNISYTSVSDLSSLEHLPLERFNCMHTKVNAASRNQFKEWHPDCLSVFTGKQPYGYGWRYNDYGYTFFEYYANMRIVFRYDDKNYHGNVVERP